MAKKTLKKVSSKSVTKKTEKPPVEKKKILADPLTIFNPLESEAKEGISTALKLVISALTLVSALAWNDAIKSIFTFLRAYFPEAGGQLAEIIGLFTYAIVVTIITVLAIGRLKSIKKKVSGSTKDKEDKEEKE